MPRTPKKPRGNPKYGATSKKVEGRETDRDILHALLFATYEQSPTIPQHVQKRIKEITEFKATTINSSLERMAESGLFEIKTIKLDEIPFRRSEITVTLPLKPTYSQESETLSTA